MNAFFAEWGNSFKSYWTEMKSAPGLNWLWLPVVIFAVWALTIMLRVALKKGPYPFKNVFTIHRRIAWASGILGALFVGAMIYYWSCRYYDTHPQRFVHLCCFFILLLIPVISLLMLRSYYRRERLREIAEHPKTVYQQERITEQVRKGFTRTKLLGLVVAAGFVALFFWGFKEDKNLVAIFIDNSSSMEEPLKNGKIALANTFRKLGANTNVVISSFTSQDEKGITSYEGILKTKKFNSVSVNNFFETPEAALTAVNDITVELNVGSPITQGVWENYQFVKQTCPMKDYKNVILLVVTDGFDNIAGPLEKSNNYLCDHPEFNEVYPAESIRIIDVEGNFEAGNVLVDTATGRQVSIALFDKAKKCGYDIQSGKGLDDYSAAVEDALRDFKKDWWLLTWMAAIYGVYLISLIFITPVRT